MTDDAVTTETYFRIDGDIPAGGLYLTGPGIYIADDSIPRPARLKAISWSGHDEMIEACVCRDGELPVGGIYIEALGTYITGVGEVLTKTHPETDECHSRGCSVHAPSDHACRQLKTHWRGDRALMERICEHGVGHPDPDHMSFVATVMTPENANAEGVHGCDGCCSGKGNFEAQKADL